METVPTLQLEHLSEAQVRALVIADNRLAELAGWDKDLLAIELQGLTEMDLDFDLEVIGFETAEIDLWIGGGAEGVESDSADASTGFDPNAPVVSRPRWPSAWPWPSKSCSSRRLRFPEPLRRVLCPHPLRRLRPN